MSFIKNSKLSVILACASILALAGCTLGPKWTQFNDTITSYHYEDTVGIADGTKGEYVVYGSLKTKTGTMKAGTCALWAPLGIFRYSIKDLIKQDPVLATPLAVKAADSQKLPKGWENE